MDEQFYNELIWQGEKIPKFGDCKNVSTVSVGQMPLISNFYIGVIIAAIGPKLINYEKFMFFEAVNKLRMEIATQRGIDYIIGAPSTIGKQI